MAITHEMLERQRQLAAQLRELREEEMALRKEIAFELGKGLDPGSYTFNQEGFTIKLKLGLNYSLDQDEVVDYIDRNLLTDAEMECIRTKYDLSLREYKKCPMTEMLDDLIIVKPSAPVLEITLGE